MQDSNIVFKKVNKTRVCTSFISKDRTQPNGTLTPLSLINYWWKVEGRTTNCHLIENTDKCNPLLLVLRPLVIVTNLKFVIKGEANFLKHKFGYVAFFKSSIVVIIEPPFDQVLGVKFKTRESKSYNSFFKCCLRSSNFLF